MASSSPSSPSAPAAPATPLTPGALRARIQKARDLVATLSERLVWLPPLVARVALGVVFVQTGWGKLHSLEQVTRFFQSLGIPAASVQAPFVAGVEFVGGLLLVAGLATRFAAVPLMGTMVVAILTAQWPHLHGIGDLFGLVELAYLMLFLWLAIAGAGTVSLDHVLTRSRSRAAASITVK
jgi:putative oxidoreductase